MPSPEHLPRSILIIGSGVFGLSTAYSLCNNTLFENVEMTLVDRAEFPAPDGASVLLLTAQKNQGPDTDRLTRLVLCELVS